MRKCQGCRFDLYGKSQKEFYRDYSSLQNYGEKGSIDYL